MHPPGHGPERLRDRQREGAGNYKSNPSSRGVKLQRKRTSKEKKRACTQRLGGFPCAPGTDPGKLQKSPEKSRQTNKSRPPKEEGLLPALLESREAATRRRRLRVELRCAGPGRAAGERGRRLDAREDAAGEGAARAFLRPGGAWGGPAGGGCQWGLERNRPHVERSPDPGADAEWAETELRG